MTGACSWAAACFFWGGFLGVGVGLVGGWLACNHFRVRPLRRLVNNLAKYCEIFPGVD